MRGAARPAVTAALMVLLVVAPSSPRAQAADSPERAVHDLLDALEEERFDDLDALVCEEHRSAIRDRFDVTASLPDVVDRERVAGAVDLVITDRTVELVEQTGERAEVHVSGRARALVDAELVRELAERSLKVFGAEVPTEQIDALATRLIEQLQAGSPIADDVSIVRQGSAWLVCDDIAVGLGSAARAEATAGACAYLSVAELNAIDEQRGGAGFDSCARSSWDEESGLCTYDGGKDGIGEVRLGRVDFPFDDLEAALPGGSREMVASHRACLSGNDLFVELEDGVLYVNAPAKATPGGEIDYLAMPAGVAELLLLRIDG